MNIASLARPVPDLGKAGRLVVKIGSALLVNEKGLRRQWLRGMVADIARVQATGTEVIVVSSGSIALGRNILELPPGPLGLELNQAAAAVGQIRLAQAYEEALSWHGLRSGQVLLTLEDSHDRRRYLNARATLRALLDLGVVPIVNENDTVATDEIRFGDNDRLAAQIAVTVEADQLVLLSDVDGIYTANPQIDLNAQHLPVIEAITPEIEAMAGDPIGGMSKGGMRTKLFAARTAMAGGCAMAIAQGQIEGPLSAIQAGARVSWFLPDADPQTARKSWITAMRPSGTLRVDAGAAHALQDGGSLLPVGLVDVIGTFARGDSVEIWGPDGIVAVGLSRYDSDEARTIKGCQSDEIEDALGFPSRGPLVHHDDLAS